MLWIRHDVWYIDNINILNEPVRDKTNDLGFLSGPTQTDLYSYKLEISDLRRRGITLSMYRKQRRCGYREAGLPLCVRICTLLVFSCEGSNMVAEAQ